MPRLTIDDRQTQIAPGATILDAARAAGIDVPTLCHLDGCKPHASCLVCLVKVNGRLVPACATRAEEGMRVESETPEVHHARRTSLELLLSDHTGDCLAPCQRVCPAHMDIPQMIRQIAAGQMRDAMATIKADIALPAVLGYICAAPCEKGCRRGAAGGALSVCLLKRHAAEADLAGGDVFVPPQAPPTGKCVAVIGAGPAGLAGAFHLAMLGHAVTVFDQHQQPGGTLRYDVPESELPRSVLDAEIALIAAMGVTFRMNTRVGGDVTLATLRAQFDAVLLCVGTLAKDAADPLGLRPRGGVVPTDSKTFALREPGLFAAGAAMRSLGHMAVRSVADGKAAALSIDRFLAGQMLHDPQRPFTVTLGQLDPQELAQMTAGAAATARHEPVAGELVGLTAEQAQAEAQRCLHCDCVRADDCRLRSYAQRYGADPHHFGQTRRPLVIRRQRAGVIYEPGKCIACGLCVRITAELGEPLGLAFIGRGFDVRPDMPFHASLDEGLTRAADACVRACPTGALTRQITAACGIALSP